MHEGGSVQRTIGGAVMARLRSWFPEREFIMRSQGHVRYLRITQRLQMTAASVVAGLLLAWVLTGLVSRRLLTIGPARK